jgi:predicted DCC family thiol-disulfide oxidoreductase YuxK
MSSDARTAVVVFDGICVLCTCWVRFLLWHDRDRRLRFTAMQSRTGRSLLERNGLDPDDPASFLLVDDAGAWRETEAVRRVFGSLGMPWRWVAHLIGMVPAGLRDHGYRTIARNRYRWFGRHRGCPLPSPEQADRFLT